MDKPACHIVYVNRDAGEDRHVRASSAESLDPAYWQNDRIRDDVQPLLDAFGDGSFFCLGTLCVGTPCFLRFG